jgi:hypothetical protein
MFLSCQILSWFGNGVGSCIEERKKGIITAAILNSPPQVCPAFDFKENPSRR